MGKVRSKKCSNIARADPTGLSKVVVEEENACQDLGPVSMFVLTILEQLRSHLAEDRDTALNSLSAASSKQTYLMEILKNDEIFKVVGPLLLDQSVSVRHAAAGALRNLSSVNMEVCERMISADVLTPLVAVLKQKYSTEWVPVPQSKDKKPKQSFRIDSGTEALIEIITLLWNLCETNECALKIFNQEKLGDMLSRFLSTEIYGIRISLSAALCLCSATEDNSDGVSNKAQLEEHLQKILMLSDDTLEAWQLLYLQTTAIGILVNMNRGDLSQTSPETIAIIMKVINSSLGIDHLTEVCKFSSDVPLSNGNHEEVYHRESDSDLKKVFELDEKCSNLVALVSAQIMSLEILSNVITSDENSVEEDDSDESIDEDFDEDFVNNEEDVEMKDICSSDIPAEVYESLSSSGTLLKVLSKIKSIPVNVKSILNDDETRGHNILRKCTILRSTALICLQNLVEVLSLTDLEKCIPIGELWTGLGTILNPDEASDDTMIEAITSAMRAVIQSIANQKSIHSASSQLCTGLTLFHQVYEAVTVHKVKVNIIRIIGCVGLQLSKFPKNAPPPGGLDLELSLNEITEYLITCLTTLKLERQGLWLAAEILDTLFDVFAEDDYNHILKKVGLIQKLKGLQQAFKKQVRSERRSLGDNAAVIQTANTNLPRFIQYKEKHGAC